MPFEEAPFRPRSIPPPPPAYVPVATDTDEAALLEAVHAQDILKAEGVDPEIPTRQDPA